MSLAIKFGDNNDPEQISGFIYFDVVTKYSKQLTGKVTSHPLDAGASITDHYISENPKYSITGIISSADITSISEKINVDGDTPLNINRQTAAISVNDNYSGVSKFLGSQSISNSPPTVMISGGQRTDYKDQVNSLMAQLMTGLVYDDTAKKLRNRMTLITLYEFKNEIMTLESNDLVMTNFTFEEDADSGNGLYVTITLEQVSFVTLQKTELPKDVAAKLNKSAQSTSKKSKADGTEKTPGEDSTSSDPGPKLSRRELNELELREAKKAKADLAAKKK